MRPRNAPQLADAAVEATVRTVSGSEGSSYGVALRLGTPAVRGYLLYVTGRGLFGVDRITEHGSITVLASRHHSALKPGGEPNTIRLAARGKLLSVIINGQQVATVEDEAVSAAGGGALVVSSGLHVVAQRMKVGPSTDQDFAPPPAPRPIFEDRFANNHNQWPLGEDSTDGTRASFQHDGYHLAVRDEQPRSIWSFWPAPAQRLSDVAAEADVHFVDGRDDGSFGLSVLESASTRDRGYALLITADRTFRVVREDGDRFEELIPEAQTAALRPGSASNTIRLAVRGGALSVFINGQQVGYAKDAHPLPAGRVALRVASGVQVAFRRLSVAAPTAGEVAPVGAPLVMLEDSFVDNRYGWREAAGRWFDEDGYHVSQAAHPDDDVHLVADGSPWAADVAAQVALRFVSEHDGDIAGITVRHDTDPRQRYSVLIDPLGNFSLLRVDADGAHTLVPWQPHAALREGDAVNYVRLAVRGQQLAVRFNGQPAALIEDPDVTEPGRFGLIVGGGAHVVFRHASVAEPTDGDFVPPPPPAQVPPNVSSAPAPPACLPEVEGVAFVLSGIKAQVKNSCGVPRTFGLGLVVLDQPDGQPVAESATVRWDAPTGDAREVFVPVDTRGGTAVMYLRSSAAPGDSALGCENVGAATCLPVAPELRGALHVLQDIELGRTLLKRAAESGVVVLHGQTDVGADGEYDRLTRAIILSPRLDTYGDWARAAILAHELQHALDHAEGAPFESTTDCLARETDAFSSEAAVWHALWGAKLPEPQNRAQFDQNDFADEVQHDPAGFAQDLARIYRHDCA